MIRYCTCWPARSGSGSGHSRGTGHFRFEKKEGRRRGSLRRRTLLNPTEPGVRRQMLLDPRRPLCSVAHMTPATIGGATCWRRQPEDPGQFQASLWFAIARRSANAAALWGYLSCVGELLIMTATRRFCCRPIAESLPATGSFLPMPEALSRLDSMPSRTRYDLTESARRWDSAWL